MFTALEQSAFSTWLLESNSIWAYPTILTLHTFGMMVLVGSALMIDLRLLGFGRAVALESIDRLFSIMWAAFALNAVTGSMLFAADAAKLGTELQFWTKLALVGVGLCTAVLIRRGSFRTGMKPIVISGAAKRLAVLSLLAWSAAVTAGRLLAYGG
jgi:hypothetical protein